MLDFFGRRIYNEGSSQVHKQHFSRKEQMMMNTDLVCMASADFGGPALMSGKEVFEFLNVSKAHFYKTIIKADDFPKPINFYGSKRWYTATIKSWLNNKLATH
jgi:predicted DNA-binding transcriptional regulator AlpA